MGITKEREINTTSVLWIVSKVPWKSIIALSNPPKYVKGKTKQMVQILLISKQSKYFQNQKSINYLNINIFNQQLFEETDSQYFPTNLNCIKMFQYVLFTTKNCRPGKYRDDPICHLRPLVASSLKGEKFPCGAVST